jgi:hypothetical protein
MANPKEPFIPASDRPDLQSIIANPEIFKFRKDYFKEYKEFYKEYAKDIKEYAYEKDPRTELQYGPVNPGDPVEGGFAQLVAHVGGLHKKIDDLANQIAELKKSK